MQRKCYTCDCCFYSRDKSLNKPVVCSKLCKTVEFNKALSDWRLTTRGYPSGYHSKEEYENFLRKSTPTQKICVICKNSFTGLNQIECCSRDCTEKHRIIKIANTKENRYGSKGYNNRDSAKLTCLEKYGVENQQQFKEVKEKTKKTCIERYGVDNPSKSKDIIDKIKNVMTEKYGVDNVFKRIDIMQAAYERKFGKGITNPMMVKEIAMRSHNTMKSKYELMGAVPKESTIQTCQEKYGSDYFFSSKIGNMSNDNLITLYGWTEEEIKELKKKKASCSYEWALEKANGDTELADDIFIQRVLSTRNHQRGIGSKSSLKTFEDVEKYLINHWKISYNDIYIGDGKRKEYFLYDEEMKQVYFYDFTIKSKKIILEYNGCYYHPKTREFNPNQYDKDQRKKFVAESLGFTYIVVWDDKPIKENQSYLMEMLDKCLKMQSSQE